MTVPNITQWGGIVGQTGNMNNMMHSDTDALPDDVENDRTPGSIGQIYEFDPQDADTFDLGNLQGGANYVFYGDNEVLARVEGLTNPAVTHPERDWSVGGVNWDH